MSRYIDADKFKSDIKDVAKINCGSFTEFEVLGILSGQPTADVVEVVRCKDCKYFEEDIQGTGLCSLGGQLDWTNMNTMYADDFCSYGERAEE